MRAVVVPEPPARPAEDVAAGVVDGLEDDGLGRARDPCTDLIGWDQLATNVGHALLVHFE
jgi:hypothetical protein